MKLKIKRLANNQDLPLPQFQTAGSAGLDLISAEDIVITGIKVNKGVEAVVDQQLVSTGLSVEIPVGYCGMVCSRSGLAAKNKIVTQISPGIIDSDYRGELKVLLANYSENDFVIKRGDRISQMLLVPVVQMEIEETSDLSDTARGSGGFGSTQGVSNSN